jgi:hypothetical protein
MTLVKLMAGNFSNSEADKNRRSLISLEMTAVWRKEESRGREIELPKHLVKRRKRMEKKEAQKSIRSSFGKHSR